MRTACKRSCWSCGRHASGALWVATPHPYDVCGGEHKPQHITDGRLNSLSYFAAVYEIVVLNDCYFAFSEAVRWHCSGKMVLVLL